MLDIKRELLLDSKPDTKNRFRTTGFHLGVHADESFWFEVRVGVKNREGVKELLNLLLCPELPICIRHVAQMGDGRGWRSE